MCIIVDANKLGGFLARSPQAGILIYSTGGKFARELGCNAKRKLADYYRAGKVRLVPTNRFAEDEAALEVSDQLRSDDPHVLPLARESGARLLYTGDEDFITDFERLEAAPSGVREQRVLAMDEIFPPHEFGPWPEGFSLSREQLYGDEGR